MKSTLFELSMKPENKSRTPFLNPKSLVIRGIRNSRIRVMEAGSRAKVIIEVGSMGMSSTAEEDSKEGMRVKEEGMADSRDMEGKRVSGVKEGKGMVRDRGKVRDTVVEVEIRMEGMRVRGRATVGRHRAGMRDKEGMVEAVSSMGISSMADRLRALLEVGIRNSTGKVVKGDSTRAREDTTIMVGKSDGRVGRCARHGRFWT